jgi:hypothetical protein
MKWVWPLFFLVGRAFASYARDINWIEIENTAVWKPRGFARAVNLNRSILLIGGQFDAANATNEVWNSTDDGITWQLSAYAPWGSRIRGAAVTVQESVVVIGGRNSMQCFNDVWSSMNGGRHQ